MNAPVDLAPGQPPHTGLVQSTALAERSDQRGADARKLSSHGVTAFSSIPRTSLIPNHPCLPCTHFAACSAPCAKAARSRFECVIVIVSNGPSNPIVWTPGTEPALLDAMSILWAYPASFMVCCNVRAVPDGASLFAEW